jgi:hypothetical protein
MSRPSERFYSPLAGIGSLAAYDELISPMVAQARRRGTLDYLEGLRPQSVQQPVAAQNLAAAQLPVAAQNLAAAQLPRVPTLEDEFKTRRDTYRGILGDPAEQRNLTQAQILFDIANTALAFSTAGSRPGMSPAERLAEAAVETKLFPTIAARSAAQQEQQQKFDLAALQSAETSLAAKQKAAADYREALLKQGDDYLGYVWKVGDTTYGPFNMKSFSGRQEMAAAKAQYPDGSPFKVGEEKTLAKPSLVTLVDRNASDPMSTAITLDPSDPTQAQRIKDLTQNQGHVEAGNAPMTRNADLVTMINPTNPFDRRTLNLAIPEQYDMFKQLQDARYVKASDAVNSKLSDPVVLVDPKDPKKTVMLDPLIPSDYARYRDLIQRGYVLQGKAPDIRPDMKTFVDPKNPKNTKMLDLTNLDDIQHLKTLQALGWVEQGKEPDLTQDLKTFVDPTNPNNRKTLDLNNPDDRSMADLLRQAGYVVSGTEGATSMDLITLVDRDDPTKRQTFNRNDPANRATIQALINTGAILEGDEATPQTVVTRNFYHPETGEIRTIIANAPDAQKQIKQALSDGLVGTGEADNAPGATFGRGFESRLIDLLGDPEKLRQYADGTLDEGLTLKLNMAISKAAQPTTGWNSELGRNVVVEGMNFPQEVADAIRSRQSLNLAVPNMTGTALVGAINPVAAEGAAPNELEIPLNTPSFYTSLKNADGSIDLNAPNWRRLPTTLFNPAIRYERATGIGEIAQRVSNYFSENTRELGGAPMSEQGAELVQAERDLIALRNEVMMLITNIGVDDRMLKSVQDAINQEIEGFTPGMFKSDEKALGTITTTRKQLGRAWNMGASIVPEYGGDPTGYTEAQVTKYRANMKKVTDLIAELTAFEDSYRAHLARGATGSSEQPLSRSDARNLIQQFSTLRSPAASSP